MASLEFPRRAVALGCLLLLGLVAGAREPFTFGTLEQHTAAGPVRGWWAKVHLDDPAVRVDATAPLPPAAGDPPGTEVHLLPVNTWAEAQGTTLAINASFFGMIAPKPGPGEDRVRYTTGAAADIRGLSQGGGGLVSPPRIAGGHADPALLVYPGRARIAHPTDADLQGLVCAVAGIGLSDDGKQPGSLLVEAGRNTGATARVAPKIRHPRTAVGVSADGRTLVVLAVDGRRPGHSVGVTLPELADLMIELGAHDALALDGGGSTSFYLKRPDGSVVTNQPSDGEWRPVANHLGVWVKWPEPAQPAVPSAPTAVPAKK